MLNRRILRIKAFKVLYSSVLAGNMSLAEAETQLELSCEAARDLYIYMLGIVSPLTKIAQERIEAGKSKFNPTEEERNPNMKFAENALASFLDQDVDFLCLFCINIHHVGRLLRFTHLLIGLLEDLDTCLYLLF